MPAVRKPTAMLEASGAFKANPARSRPNEPNTGRGVGPAPSWLGETVRQAWDDIVRDTAPGVWQSSDRVFLEVLSGQVADYREVGTAFGVKRTTLLMGMLKQAGMTPSDRSRVQVPQEPASGKPKTGLASFR